MYLNSEISRQDHRLARVALMRPQALMVTIITSMQAQVNFDTAAELPVDSDVLSEQQVSKYCVPF